VKTFKTPKGTELPILDLRGKDYLQVAHRIVWFREEQPLWSITTQIISSDEKRSLVRASILDETGRVIAEASKQEDNAGFKDHLEKSETGAIGRALALCGFGTQFTPDLDEGERLADSPLPRVSKAPGKPVAAISPPAHTGDYIIGFGKFNGKRIGEVPFSDLQNYAKWLRQKAHDDKKELKGEVLEFIERVESL